MELRGHFNPLRTEAPSCCLTKVREVLRGMAEGPYSPVHPNGCITQAVRSLQGDFWFQWHCLVRNLSEGSPASLRPPTSSVSSCSCVKTSNRSCPGSWEGYMTRSPSPRHTYLELSVERKSLMKTYRRPDYLLGNEGGKNPEKEAYINTSEMSQATPFARFCLGPAAHHKCLITTVPGALFPSGLCQAPL